MYQHPNNPNNPTQPLRPIRPTRPPQNPNKSIALLAGGAVLAFALAVGVHFLPLGQPTQPPTAATHHTAVVAVTVASSLADTPTPGTTPTLPPTDTPTPTPQPTIAPTVAPTATQPVPTATAQPSFHTCTSQGCSNPYGFILRLDPGINWADWQNVYTVPASFCSYFHCIDNLSAMGGYIVVCQDGIMSTAGGYSQVCSNDGGIYSQLEERKP